jgi:hypothetical protein
MQSASLWHGRATGPGIDSGASASSAAGGDAGAVEFIAGTGSDTEPHAATAKTKKKRLILRST